MKFFEENSLSAMADIITAQFGMDRAVSIMEEMLQMEKTYKKLEEQSSEKFIPTQLMITGSLEKHKQTKYKINYPDLTWRNDGLKRYWRRTIFSIFAINFPYNKNEIIKLLEEASKKSPNEKISYCKINETSPEWEKPQSDKIACLYIGRSGNTEGIHRRLKEHLFGYNPKRNAMHLDKWFREDIVLRIHIWGLTKFWDSEKSDFLDKLESLLWKYFQPLFGKQRKKQGRRYD